jgi:hypothetical protein
MKVALIAVQLDREEYLALALRNLNHGHHSYQRGNTRSCALRLLQSCAVQNPQLHVQKVPEAP